MACCRVKFNFLRLPIGLCTFRSFTAYIGMPIIPFEKLIKTVSKCIQTIFFYCFKYISGEKYIRTRNCIFHPRPVLVGFLVGEVAMEQGSFSYLGFSLSLSFC
jgi:hypothetical protein